MASKDKDAALLASVRNFMAETRIDDKMEEGAIGKIVKSEVLKSAFKITYINGVTAIISGSYDLFNLDISDKSLYELEDNNYTPMGIDRIKYYQGKLMNHEYL